MIPGKYFCSTALEPVAVQCVYALVRGAGDISLSIEPSVEDLPFRELARRLPTPCWISDAEGGIIWVNEAWLSYTGMDVAEIGREGLEKIHDPEIFPLVAAKWKEVKARGETDEMVFPMRGRDGLLKPFLTRVVPLRDRTGTITRWFGTNTDITGIHSVAQRLEERNRDLLEQAGLALAKAKEAERLRDRFWETSQDLLGVISVIDGRLRMLNSHAWQRTLGYPDEEIQSIRLIDLIHPDDRSAAMDLKPLLAEGGTVVGFENRYRHKDGHWVWLSWNATREGDNNYVIARDVTADKAAQVRLSESERQLRLMVASVMDCALFMLTADGTVATWNAGAERIKGYSANEIIGRHISTFHTDGDKAAGMPLIALETAAREGRYEAEAWRVRKSGELFWANVVIDAIHDDRGHLIGFAKITRDFTERRRAQIELQQAQEQVAHMQKMEALGRLTGGVAHDFNNLLAVVSGGVKMLQRTDDPERREALYQSMNEAVDKGARLTRQLLMFARGQASQKETFDAVSLIGSLREMMTRSIGEDIDIEIDLPQERWLVDADAGQFELALLNLVVNARDAMPEGGQLSISVQNAIVRGEATVRVTVADNGPGMPPGIAGRAFEPFFTTKEVGKGSGLGLAQVYGFAQQAGGAAYLRTAPGEGVTVIIDLPRSTRALPVARSETWRADPKLTLALAGKRILLVEDDPSVAGMTRLLLENAGVTCHLAANAREAMSLLDAERFTAVLSDIVMPGGISGLDLARSVRRRWPLMPVVLTTGYSGKADISSAEFPVLQKPCDPDELLATMARVVAGAG